MAAGIIVGVLAVLGILVGLLWWAISPGRPLGIAIAPGQVVADETESFISTDGRFLILTAVVGLVAGVLAWRRRSWRGPLVPLALALGGLLGALLTDLIGRTVGGGQSAPTPDAATLKLAVHAEGFLLAEAFVGVVVYALCALFANHDDLGRTAEVSGAIPAADAEPSPDWQLATPQSESVPELEPEPEPEPPPA